MKNIHDGGENRATTEKAAKDFGNVKTPGTPAEGACTKTRNNETKPPKRNHRNERNGRNEQNETAETSQMRLQPKFCAGLLMYGLQEF